MNAAAQIDPVDPRQRHQAMVLGLCLGGGCLVLIVTFIIIFSNVGLPKDPKEVKRLQQQEANKGFMGTSEATPKEVSK